MSLFCNGDGCGDDCVCDDDAWHDSEPLHHNVLAHKRDANASVRQLHAVRVGHSSLVNMHRVMHMPRRVTHNHSSFAGSVGDKSGDHHNHSHDLHNTHIGNHHIHRHKNFHCVNVHQNMKKQKLRQKKLQQYERCHRYLGGPCNDLYHDDGP